MPPLPVPLNRRSTSCLVAVCLLSSLTVAACGGGSGPDPTIGASDAGSGGTGIGVGDTGGAGTGGSNGDGTTGDAATGGPGADLDSAAGSETAMAGDTTDEDDAGPLGDAAAAGDTASLEDAAAAGDTTPVEDSPPVVDPPITLTPEYTDALCKAYCGAYGETCGNFDGLGANYLGCVEDCVAIGTGDAWWIAAYGCASSTCDLAGCGVGADAPPQEDDTCEVACSATDLCDQLALLQLPEDEPELCRVACTASVLASPGAKDGLACIIDALDPTCDQAAVNECFGGTTPAATACPGYCASHYDPVDNLFCAEDTVFRSVWPTTQDCVGACSALGDGLAALKFVGCTQGGGCTDPTACAAPPAEDPKGCVDSCTEFIALCGALGPFTDPSVCAAYCTGVVINYGGQADPDAGACVDSIGTCPADPATHGGLFFSCLLPKDPTCSDLCERYWTCADPAVTAATLAQCATACAAGALGSATQTAEVHQCMVDHEGDCAAVAACVPAGADQVDPLCAAGCQKVGACSDGVDSACYGKCNEDLQAGATTVAELTCAVTAACEDVQACDGVGAEPVQDCANACTVASGTCGAWDEGCVQACAGVLAGFGLEPTDAYCVVGALGTGCDFAAVGYACAGWDPPAAEPVDWQTQVLPILQASGCTGGYCHGGGASDLTIVSPETLIAGGAHGPAVVPCDSESSLIMLKLGPNPPYGDRMPKGMTPLTDEQMDVIRAWIDQGATEVYDAGACTD